MSINFNWRCRKDFLSVEQINSSIHCHRVSSTRTITFQSCPQPWELIKHCIPPTYSNVLYRNILKPPPGPGTGTCRIPSSSISRSHTNRNKQRLTHHSNTKKNGVAVYLCILFLIKSVFIWLFVYLFANIRRIDPVRVHTSPSRSCIQQGLPRANPRTLFIAPNNSSGCFRGIKRRYEEYIGIQWAMKNTNALEIAFAKRSSAFFWQLTYGLAGCFFIGHDACEKRRRVRSHLRTNVNFIRIYNNAFDLGAPQTSVSAPLIWWWWDPRGIRMPRRSPCSAVWECAVSVLMWILVEMMSQSSAREPAMETLGHCILFDQRQTTMNGIPTVQRSKNYVWCMCDCRFIFNLVCEVSADRA